MLHSLLLSLYLYSYYLIDFWIFSGEISRESFISTLNRANQLTRHIHELCHHGGRSLFGISVVDAASFFFAVDQDKSGDLSLDEIKAGLQEINGEVGHGKVTNEQIDQFLEWLGKIQKANGSTM